MKTLVIAEKPSVGRDIGRVLSCAPRGNGYMEGRNYVVTWAMGHLVTLKDPEDYDKKYKEWKLDVLPIMPEKLQIKVIPQTGKQYRQVESLLNRQDVGEVVIATDAGREGELVARWILKKAGCRKPLKRLWISSVTDKAIRDGFSCLKDAREYDHLYEAAVSRAEADWLVGINATRALTCKYNAQLSCGRVQTPTLAMIAAREEEIRSFQPETYYGIRIQAEGITFAWQDQKTGSTRTFSKERAEEIRRKAEGSPLRILKAEKKQKRRGAPQLYDLTELQRDANKKYGFSAKETLNIMQRLYEHHKVLTYPRTDSRYLSSDLVPTLRERLEAVKTGPYRGLAAKAARQDFHGKLPFVNNAKVSDHHAIIPTEQYVQLQAMSSEERKIYDLVVRRFLAVLLPASVYEEVRLTAEAGGWQFAAKGTTMLCAGWREAYEDEPEEEEPEEDQLKDQRLPQVQEGQNLKIQSVRVTEGKTKPPARFTEAALLSAMENPVRYLEEKNGALAKTLGETGGLGTVATRADIIEKLFSTFLLEKRGSEILITSKARQLLKLVPEDLKKPELTARWELKLSQMAKGRLKRDEFMKNIRAYAGELIREIRTEEGVFRHENLTNKICPRCGKRLLAVNGKNARLLVCQDRECGYRETVSRTTNARCPVCHKRMELVGKGEGAVFVCPCGHKEKLSKFEERRKKEGAGVTKRDVARYLARQKEAETPVNNSFAEALKNIKLS